MVTSNAYQPVGGPYSMGGSTGYDHNYSNGRVTMDMLPKPQGDRGNSFEASARHDLSIAADFFGTPDIERFEEDLKWAARTNYSDYPELFTHNMQQYFGDNYVARVIMEKARASEEYPTRTMAPWQLSNSMIVAWSEIRFHRHMMDRLAEQSLPRTTTYTNRRSDKTLVRYGMCLMHETTFFNTPHGQKIHMLNIEQIKIAVVETADFGCMTAFLQNVPTSTAHLRNRNIQNSSLGMISKSINDYNQRFCSVQKGASTDSVIATADKELSNRNVNGDTFTVVPAGFQLYCSGSSKSTPGYDLDTYTGAFPNGAISRTFSGGPNDDPHDPCFREVTNGGFFTLWDRGTIRDSRGWRTDNYNCQIFDEEQNTFTQANYCDLFLKSGIWDFKEPFAPLTDKLGKGLFTDLRAHTFGQMMEEDGTLQRTVQALLRIDDPALRQRFSESLALLPTEDKRVRNFNRANYNPVHLEECINGIDVEFSKQVNFGEQKRIENSILQHGAGSTAAEREQYYDQKDRAAKRTYSSAFADANILTEKDVFESEALMEDVPSYSLGGPEVTYTEQADGTIVERTKGKAKRFKAGVQRELAGAKPVRKSITDMLIADIRQLLMSIGPADKDNEIESASSDKVTDVYNSLFPLLSRYNEFTDIDYQTQFLSNFKKIVDGERRRYPTETSGSVWVNILMASFAPILAKMQVPHVLNGVTVHRTSLESYCHEKSIRNPENVQDQNILKTGWWLVGADQEDAATWEDGQVSLSVFPSEARCSSLPLPVDSFASTLTANYTVLFQNPGSNVPIPIAAPMKQARTDALVTSVLLSMLVACDSRELAGALGIAIRGDSNLCTRVKRHSLRTTKINVLPSQMHLQGRIEFAYMKLQEFVDGEHDLFVIERAAEIRPREVIQSVGIVDRVGYVPPIVPHEIDETIYALVQAWADICTDGAVGSVEPGVTDLIAEIVHTVFSKRPHVLTPEVIELITSTVAAKGGDREKYLAAFQMVMSPSASEKNSVSQNVGSWTYAGISDLLMRACVTSGTLALFLMENDIPMPFFVRGWRNNRAYRTGTMIHIIKGCAKTFYMNPHWMGADDAARKTTFGNLSIYFTTIITEPDKVVLVDNALCAGYIDGNCTRVWDPLNEDDVSAWKAGRMDHASIFVTIGPMNQAAPKRTNTTWQVIDGRIPREFNASAQDQDAMAWPGSKAFRQLWSFSCWDDTMPRYSSGCNYDYEPSQKERQFNTICCQEVQLMVYNPDTGKKDGFVRDTGAWGENVDVNCREARSGKGMRLRRAGYLDKPNLNEIGG